MSKKGVFIALLATLGLLLSGATAERKGDKIVLSSNRMLVEIDLTRGGRVCKLFDKKIQKDLAVLDNAPGGSGIFADSLFYPDSRRVDRRYEKMAYSAGDLKSGSKASVTLTSPKGLPLTIKKTISLADDSELLVADFEITNPGEADVIAAYRGGNTFRFAGEKSYKISFPEAKRSNSWNEPDTAPVKNHFTYNPGELKGADLFFYQPKRDYVSVTGSQAGIVFEVPFPLLSFFYSWMSNKSDGYPVIDFFTTRFLLPPLSKGEKEAVLLTVLDDPLARYKYRFRTQVRLISPANFAYEKFRAPSTAAKDTAFLPVYTPDTMFSKFKTPALVFAPVPAKPLSILAVGMVPGNHEMGEFIRRSGVNMDVVDAGRAFNASPYWGWNCPDPQMLIENLITKKPQIILVCGHNGKSLKPALLKKITSLVENGAAFVYVGHRNNFPSLIPQSGGRELDPKLFAGNSWEKFPVKGKILEFTRGKGKVIQVRFNMEPANTEWVREARNLVPHIVGKPGEAFWEYYFAFYGKLFNYAAGNQASAKIESAVFDLNKFTARISGKAGSYTVKAITTCGVAASASGAVGEVSGNFAGTRVSGKELMMLQLWENGKVIDYCFADYSGEKLPECEIAFAKENFAANEKVTGTLDVDFSGKVSLLLREAASRRVIAKAEISVKPGKNTFALARQIPSPESLFYLEASSGSVRAGKYIFAKADAVEHRNIFPLIWGAHFSSWRDKMFNTELYDAGFEIYMAPMAYTKQPGELKSEALSVMASGMEYAPLGVEHIKAGNARNSMARVRTPCLSAAAYKERISRKAENISGKMAMTNSKWAFISDEITLGTYFNTPHNFCFCGDCMTDFRKEMQALYKGDLKLLNTKWGTGFSGWDKVVPPTALEAGKSKNYAGFIAHRIFMYSRIDNICKLIADTIKVRCGGETGVSGMGIRGIYQGFDLMKNSAWLKSSAFYHDAFGLDAIRSSMVPGSRTGSFSDYGMRYALWEQVISGLRAPSVWWYGHLVRRGDGVLSSEGEQCKKIFRNMRDSGAMEVLGFGKRKAAKAALVWSIPSLVACAGASYPSPANEALYQQVMLTWSSLFRDLGMDSPDVITPAQFAALDPKRYPLVILPLTRMLSAADAAHLERFVRNGGTLIADYAPGIVDEYGALVKTSPLSKVFGVEIAPAAAPGTGEFYFGKSRLAAAVPGQPVKVYPGAEVRGSLKRTIQGMMIGSIRMNPSVKTVAPAMIVNRCGRGKAIYFNAILPAYDTSSEEKGATLRAAAREIFTIAGVDMKPAHTLPNGANYAEYEYEGVRYLFVSRRNNQSSGKFNLKLGRNYYVYEMISGKYAGYTANVKGVLKAGDVRMFALSEKRLPAAYSSEISCDGRNFKVGFNQSGAPGTLFQIKVFHNGRELRKLGRVTAVGKGQLISIDGGLKLSGTYRIELIRIADRKTVAKTFKF